MREPLRYRALVKNLVLADLKLKYRGSVLGVAWSLLHPLLLLGVYTIAFRYILRIQMENYSVFLLTGLLPWTFFAGSLQASTGSIITNANLIRKVYFPREILPVATVLFNFAQFLLALVVLVPILLLLSRASIGVAAVLLFPWLLLFHVLFTVGFALVLSAVTAHFRDVAHLTEVVLALLFWLTPIIYPADMVPPSLAPLFRLNPCAAFAIAYQDILFRGRAPGADVAATILGATALAFIGGYAVFRRLSPALAEEV